MGEIKSGYILYGLDRQYSFTYDGELLQLVPLNREEIKPYDFLENRLVEKELLNGETVQHDYIFFLKCRLQRNNSGYIAKPAGYVCFDGKIQSFKTIEFKGKAVDFFYSPNQILAEGSEYPFDEDGGGQLLIKKFSEVTKHNDVNIIGEKADFLISITRPKFPEYMIKDYTLGIPQSFIRLEFENDISIEKFAKIYIWMQNFFEFIFFRKNVFIENIELGTFNNEQKVRKVAEVYLFHKRELDITNPDTVIGYYFVEDGLNQLLQILNTESLNMLFIPISEKDDKYIDPQRYMACCSSFESVFNFAFPNAKMEENVKMREAKLTVLGFIDSEIDKSTGKSKKEYKSLRRIIELADFSLEQKYIWCLKKYDTYISEYCKKVYRKLNINQEQVLLIPNMFALKRNILIHSNLDKLEPEEIAAYSIMRYLIYFIILDKSGISKNLIRDAVSNIL